MDMLDMSYTFSPAKQPESLFCFSPFILFFLFLISNSDRGFRKLDLNNQKLRFCA